MSCVNKEQLQELEDIDLAFFFYYYYFQTSISLS